MCAGSVESCGGLSLYVRYTFADWSAGSDVGDGLIVGVMDVSEVCAAVGRSIPAQLVIRTPRRLHAATGMGMPSTIAKTIAPTVGAGE